MARNPNSRIAIVGEDATIAADTLATMRAAGHACYHFPDAESVLTTLEREQFDLLLVTGTQPSRANAALLTGIHARMGFSLPIMGLSAADDSEGAIAALDQGMDHILAWPVAPPVLLAQVNAALRRSGRGVSGIDAAIGHLVFRREGPSVQVDGKPVLVTAKEYALGLMLCRNLGQALDREQIFRTIWGEEVAPTTRTLDVHVSRLRTKLILRPDRGFRLSALYGRGYRLDYSTEGAMPRGPTTMRLPLPPMLPLGRRVTIEPAAPAI
jgi:DNA-binding response OmpR family regulator